MIKLLKCLFCFENRIFINCSLFIQIFDDFYFFCFTRHYSLSWFLEWYLFYKLTFTCLGISKLWSIIFVLSKLMVISRNVQLIKYMNKLVQMDNIFAIFKAFNVKSFLRYFLCHLSMTGIPCLLGHSVCYGIRLYKIDS